MKRLINNQSGSALAMTLFIFMAISILIASLLITSSAEATMSKSVDSRIKTHYIGRSGVYLGLDMIKDKVSSGTPAGYLGNDPAKNDVEELVEDLNVWASTISPQDLNTNESFTVSFQLIGNRNIKIISEGSITGGAVLKSTVSANVEMLTSLLTSGKAVNWYNGQSAVLNASVNPNTNTYLGQGVLFEGKDGVSPTTFPSNGNPPIYQASVIQALAHEGESIVKATNSQNVTLDAEIILFVGDVIIEVKDNDTNGFLKLTLSEDVAKNKVLSSSSVLYITNTALRTALYNNGITKSVGFEDVNYYKYFAEANDAEINTADFKYSDYTFEPSRRYGLVYFGGELIRRNKGDVERLPYTSDSDNEPGFYFFPDNIDINGTDIELSRLIPMDKDDPLVSIIDSRLKVTMSNKALVWDNK